MRQDENEPDAPDATLDGAQTVVDAPVGETVVVPERSPTIAETLVVPQPSPTIAQTVVVADDARPHPAAKTVRVPDEPAPSKRAVPRPSHRMARLWLAAVVVVVALFLASASAALLLGLLTSIDARSAAPSHASCEGEPPSAVVIAELAQGRPLPTRDDLVAHVAALPPASVTVHRRARAAGRAVTLELSSSSWPDWPRLAEGASGRDVCDRIAEAIASRGAHAHSFHAGRPRHATEEPV
ncbi:MAG: hypothetical protein IT379_09040, partial [Deltaproteobacteria bacterium]|nr:hypothetical protein [Deltaproteobacteria bacterium]